MKVILKKDIPNLGRSGDIKEVKNGYARNYLLPNDLVMSATAKTAKQQLFLEKMQERKIAKRKKTAQEMATSLQNKEVRVTVKTGEDGKLFGSVTNIHIQKVLEAEGTLVDKKVIQLDDPIRMLGEYNIVLKLYEGVQTNIHLFVQDENGNLEAPQEVPETSQDSDSADDTSAETTAEENSESVQEGENTQAENQAAENQATENQEGEKDINNPAQVQE